MSRTSANYRQIFSWNKISGYDSRKIIGEIAGGIKVTEYSIPSNGAPGGENSQNTKILFFSDLHYDSSLFENGTSDAINALEPDFIVFGGDLITFSCHYSSAFKFMQSLKAKIAKISVLGNWDYRKNRKIIHFNQFAHDYSNAGFKLLSNDILHFANISFTDPAYILKAGNDSIIDTEHSFTIVVSHIADRILDRLPEDILPYAQLILSGHTHGGQIRLPFFGALKTSSKYWKFFEYGHYFNRKYGTSMIVTSGIGTNWIPIRCFCDPEVVMIKIT